MEKNFTLSHNDIILIGNRNCSVGDSNAGFQMLKSFLYTYNMLPCDDLIVVDDIATYANMALGHSSYTDNCFLPSSLRATVNIVSLID